MMELDLKKQRLPEIFKRGGKDCYLDPIRKKLIYVTPEETVRQSVISYLTDELHVPAEVLRVEENLSHYQIKSVRRADIILHRWEEDGLLYPVAVVECKAPDVYIDQSAIHQVADYCDALGCDYGMIVNGSDTFCIRFNSETNSYEEIESLPNYDNLLKDRYVKLPEWEMPPRVPFKKLREEVLRNRDGYFCILGKDTEPDLAVCALHLFECFRDVEHLLKPEKFGLFELVRDCGLREMTYGDASGGKHNGLYRFFLIAYGGTTEFVSLGISSYSTYAKQDIEKTVLNVAIDSDQESHHSLQLVIDDNVVFQNGGFIFYHHGRIAVGNKGSGKISELRKIVAERYPSIIDGEKFNLGTLKNDRLWFAEDSQMKAFLENVISYALIRDEYRKIIQNKDRQLLVT